MLKFPSILSFSSLGNASGIGDGAAICILTTRERAEKEGMNILGKWVASTVVGESTRSYAFRVSNEIVSKV